MTYRAVDAVDLSGITFPLQTRAGVMWAPPIKPPHVGRMCELRDRARDGHFVCAPSVCAFCPYESRCREAVARGDFIGCEGPIERELIEVTTR